MIDVTKITDAMIEGAACVDDLDAALKPLMDTAGIMSGDVAGQCLRPEEWRKSHFIKRHHLLEEWLAAEMTHDD